MAAIKEPTKKGYQYFELLSALQKCIRRGMEYEAVFFAVELAEFGLGGATMLWNRLKIIASEDIGVANPLMPVLIEVLHNQYVAASKKTGTSDKLFMVNAVICLCRSPKSRITYDLLNVVYTERAFEGKHVPIPDFALDMHTARGKAKGRGMEHFFTESNKLENEAFANPYTTRAKELLTKYGKPE